LQPSTTLPVNLGRTVTNKTGIAECFLPRLNHTVVRLFDFPCRTADTTIRRHGPEHLRMTVMKSGLESNRREPKAVQAVGEISATQVLTQAHLRGASWKCYDGRALRCSAAPPICAEALDVATAAPQPAGVMTTSTTEAGLPIATSSSNSHEKEGPGRSSQRVALNRSEAVDASLDRRPIG
jgi:hypothetical protein